MEKNKNVIKFIIIIILAILLVRSLLIRKENQEHYENGKTYLYIGEYDKAQEEFELSNGFKDAYELQEEAREKSECSGLKKAFEVAASHKDEGNYELSLKEYQTINSSLEHWSIASSVLKEVFLKDSSSIEDDNKPSIDYIDQLKLICTEEEKDAKYLLAVEKYNSGELDVAQSLFSDASIANYKDTNEYLAKINLKKNEQAKATVYQKAVESFDKGDYSSAKADFELISDYRDSLAMGKECENRIQRLNKNNTIFVGINCSGAISRKEGKVLCAGKNYFGQLDTQNWNNMISVDGYNTLTIGIDKEKHAFVTGKYDLGPNWEGGKRVDTTDWDSIVDVAAGEQFVIALSENGKVFFGGHDGNNLKSEIEAWEDIVAIEAGYGFAVGLTKDHKLVFAGKKEKIEKEYLANQSKWNGVVNIAASGGNVESKYITYGHVVGLKEDGTTVSIGDNNYCQCDVEGWHGITKISAGDWFTVGITEKGTVVITGSINEKTPGINFEKVEKCENIVDIAAGFGSTIYVDQNGTYDAFGFDASAWKELIRTMNNN